MIIPTIGYQGVPTQTQAARAGGMQEIIDTAYIKMINGELDSHKRARDFRLFPVQGSVSIPPRESHP